MVMEFRRYRYKKTNGMITDTPEKKHDHLCDCLRYLAMFRPRYVPPPKPMARKGAAVLALERKRVRQKNKGQEDQRGVVRLG
jgi:hypothetical protein